MQDDFNKWCDLWDKAQKDGIFQDATKPPVTNPQTSDSSFFGLSNTHPSDCAKDCDTQYWNDVYDLSKGEEPHRIDEAKKSMKDVLQTSANAIVRSPNPITASSVGVDQDLTPESLGATFSEKDIEELAELKIQLHDLTSKLAAFEGTKTKQLESKLTALQDKINELSDELSRSLGEKKSAQGVEVSSMR